MARQQHHSLHILMTLNVKPCLEMVKGGMAWHFRNQESKDPTAQANNVAYTNLAAYLTLSDSYFQRQSHSSHSHLPAPRIQARLP